MVEWPFDNTLDRLSPLLCSRPTIVLENGAYELLNLGDIAMLRVTYRRLAAMWPAARIFVITSFAERLKAILPYAEPILTEDRNAWLETFNLFGWAHHLVPKGAYRWLVETERHLRSRFPVLAMHVLRARFGAASARFLRASRFVSLIRDADLVVAAGGGYVNDSFKVHALTLLDVLSLAQTLGRPTCMVGQGFGPVSDPALKRTAREVLCRTNLVLLRDDAASRSFVRECGVNEDAVLLTGDDAIESAFARKPGVLGRHIGINIRVAAYSGLSGGLLPRLGKLITDFAAQVAARFEVIPISHSTRPGKEDSDLDATLALVGSSLERRSDQPTSVDDVIEAAGRCRIVVTASYHAAVFGLSQGVSVIAIVGTDYFRSKFAGLVGQFGLGLEICDLRLPDWEIDLARLLHASWQNAESNRQGLLAAAQAQVASGIHAYRRLGDVMGAAK